MVDTRKMGRRGRKGFVLWCFGTPRCPPGPLLSFLEWLLEVAPCDHSFIRTAPMPTACRPLCYLAQAFLGHSVLHGWGRCGVKSNSDSNARQRPFLSPLNRSSPPGGLGPSPATGRSVHLAATMRLKQENAHPAISLVADNQGDVTS